uniref:Uncharacterized protein n=1 Tax=Anguilla anguilla TaxID=7936 RepID=A0A0E9QWN5_ANGAN
MSCQGTVESFFPQCEPLDVGAGGGHLESFALDLKRRLKVRRFL